MNQNSSPLAEPVQRFIEGIVESVGSKSMVTSLILSAIYLLFQGLDVAFAQGSSLKENSRDSSVLEAPVIDGTLDEEEWKEAHPLDDFVQREPLEGSAPTEKTVVNFLYDDEALYVGARMYSKNPQSLRAGATRRDDIGFAVSTLVSPLLVSAGISTIPSTTR
jgi:hypothetical protein